MSIAQIDTRSRSRSKSVKRRVESPQYGSPRQKLYEAKFEKYLANKEMKKRTDKKLESMQKEDFDRHTKGPESPSKAHLRYKSKE